VKLPLSPEALAAVTLEEQLDELLAMAADAGRLGAEHAAAEKARDFARDRARAGRRARAYLAQYTTAERRLSCARQRFLSRHEAK
jgi:hypothetical protein